MKKSISLFAAASAVFWAAVLGAGLFFGILRYFLIIGAAVWVAAFVRFCSIKYEFPDGEIRITSGVLLRTSKTVKTENILYKSKLILFGHFLALRLHTAGGGITLFCDCF